MLRENEILMPPCCFCGYRGTGYWLAGTHAETCPWHGVSTRQQRGGALRQVLMNLSARVNAIVVAEVPPDPPDPPDPSSSAVEAKRDASRVRGKPSKA